ncbi:plasmid pRiA4b ORF-3 family protein [Candidatus Uabimicrobium sp. HlEnr_7]|uniref:plasmid pRiA4b ORF-3 family protein n=1 Tax=Candidatus Uabimicrobium helgolandensis TaxID=3095367 RepID=UPI0035570DB9
MTEVRNKMSLEKALDQFIENTKRPFRLEKVIQFIVPRLKKVPKNLYISLDRMLRRDRRFFYDNFKELYVPRSYFFKNTQFLIKPTTEEIREGILYPGHRFIPFCHWEVFPTACQLRLGRRKLKTIQVKKRFQDILIYHTLLGKENIISYLLVDHEDNGEILSKPNIMIEDALLNVFDMKDFFASHNFEEGDSILVTVKDWVQGKYTIEYKKTINSDLDYHNNKKQWIKNFEDKMLDTFKDEGTLTSIYEQLAIAFFKSGKEILKKPFAHIGGVLAVSEKIEIAPLGMTSILWHQGEAPEDAIDFDSVEYQIGMTGNADSIDGILQDLGVALNEQVVEAFIRDEFYTKRKDFKKALERCLPMQIIEFYDEEQQKSFGKLTKQLWNKIEKSYNIFCDKHAGKYRNKALLTLEFYYTWLYSLEKKGIEEKNCPKRETLALGEMQVMLMHLVAGFNSGDSEDLVKQKDMMIALEDIDHSSKTFIEIIEREATRAMRPILKVVNSHTAPREEQEDIYYLKISLKKSKPLIWRRICVPGNISLAALHDIIQVTMGWENNHEHCFTIDEVVYGDMSSDYHLKDEQKYALNELITENKTFFSYEYDFQDSWQHKIVVEKITSHKDKDVKIKCLAGKNACPPENCGGIYGYEEMLQILKDASDPEHLDLQDWLHGFDPKLFSIKDVNKYLENL